MKNNNTFLIFVSSIIITLILGLLYLRLGRFKLIRCLKNVEKERQETVEGADLTAKKIISIEQAMDRKRDECYELYKR